MTTSGDREEEDNDNISVLLLLNISAAFDATDHQILLSRLNSVFVIQSIALQWFQSYLSDRYSPLHSITRLCHITAHASGLSTWARSLRPVHYTHLFLIS